MGRKAKESTLEAFKLVGTPKEEGGFYTCYSAAKKVGANIRTVSKYFENHKANLASSSNEGVSGESQ